MAEYGVVVNVSRGTNMTHNIGFQRDDIVSVSENEGSGSSQPEFFCCLACCLCFPSKVHFDQHTLLKQSARQPGKFRCTLCACSTDCSSTLATHRRTHTGERPFACELFRNGFRQGGHLQTHQQALLCEDKPHECDVCGKSFRRSSGLAEHKRTVHPRNGPKHVCLHCRKGFMRRDKLRNHIRTHTGERPYACRTCGIWFAETGTRAKHEAVVHEGRYAHYCPHCGHGITKLSNLKKHLATKHPEEGGALAVETT